MSAGYRAALNSFASGEIGRQIRSRWDTNKYQTGLDEAYNVLILPSGGVYNRPGLRLCSSLRDPLKTARLFPFTFSVAQSYALEFTDQRMRVYYEGGLVLQPELEITAASNTNPLTVTIPSNGYLVGQEVYFLPGTIDGMTELNGLTLVVLSVAGDVVTFDADATGWGTFTGSTGGVPGNDEGGTGGYPPPPMPGDPDPPPPTFDDYTPPPPTSGVGDRLEP